MPWRPRPTSGENLWDLWLVLLDEPRQQALAHSRPCKRVTAGCHWQMFRLGEALSVWRVNCRGFCNARQGIPGRTCQFLGEHIVTYHLQVVRSFEAALLGHMVAYFVRCRQHREDASLVSSSQPLSSNMHQSSRTLTLCAAHLVHRPRRQSSSQSVLGPCAQASRVAAALCCTSGTQTSPHKQLPVESAEKGSKGGKVVHVAD